MRPTDFISAALAVLAGVVARWWIEYTHRALAVTTEGELVVEGEATVIEAERVLRRTR